MYKLSTIQKSFVLGLLLLILIGVFVTTYGIWTKKQNSYHVTPEEFISLLLDNGYIIENIYYEDYVPGPMAAPIYAMRCTLYHDNGDYGLYVSTQKSWDAARASVKAVNALDKRMNGGYVYAFALGDLMVQILPSHKEVGEELYGVLKGSLN